MSAATLELVHDLKPELDPFGLLDPLTQDVLLTAPVHANGQVDGLAPDQSVVADPPPAGRRKTRSHRTTPGPHLPSGYLFDCLVGHRRDQIPGDLDAVELAHVALDVPSARAADVQSDDLVVESRETPAVPGGQSQLESSAPDRQLHLPFRCQESLAT